MPMLVDAATLELTVEMQGALISGVESVKFSPNGSQLVSADVAASFTSENDKRWRVPAGLRVWDVAKPRPYNACEWKQIEGPFPGAKLESSEPNETVVTY